MKIAVIQHRLRETLEDDIDALAAAIGGACASGARVVVCPWLSSFAADAEHSRSALFDRVEGCPEGTAILIPFRQGPRETVSMHTTPVGEAALLLGDECIDAEVMGFLASELPQAVVLRPCSESELQAEAFLEHALGLSASAAGLVVIAECVGAPLGEPGQGGSAIAILGEIEAEATGDEEVLLLEVDVPVKSPEPREEMPAVPPILEQRVAYHEGRKPDVGYLADLS